MNGFQTQNESVGKDWKARSLSSGQQRTVPPALAATGDISCEEAGLGSRQTASSAELCQGGQSPNSGWSHFSPARSTTPDNARMQEEEDNTEQKRQQYHAYISCTLLVGLYLVCQAPPSFSFYFQGEAWMVQVII